jgi:hypothetical protein
MKITLLSWIFIAAFLQLNAQDTTHQKKTDYKLFDRIVFLGSNFRNSIFLYLDGPRVMIWLDKKQSTKLGLAFFPTMYYRFDTKTITPLLGGGLRFDYKKMAGGILLPYRKQMETTLRLGVEILDLSFIFTILLKGNCTTPNHLACCIEWV